MPSPKHLLARSARPRRRGDASATQSPSRAPKLDGLLFRQLWIAPLVLTLLTLAVYARSLAVPLLDWDDTVYLFRDARLESLHAENLWRMLTQPFFANFHPVTTLTYAFDRAVWGTWVPGFHLTHLGFYLGGVLGLYFLFARLLGSRTAALLGAAIYAVHTIHVESVAWLACRKDVVCLFFYVLALLTYVRYAVPTGFRWKPYVLSILFAAAAMLSKGYAVILPAAMLAYDFCFSGRISRRQLLDKVPFLILTAATTLLTVYAQDRDSALIQSTTTGAARVALLAKIFALYVGRTILPIQLSAFYTVADERAGMAAFAGLVLAVALIGAFFALRRRIPAVSFGIALFGLPLATVMNVFFTLRIWMTDRYLLFPTIGSALVVAALAAQLYQRRVSRGLRVALAGVAILTISLYSALTYARVDLWTSRVDLWSDTLRKELHLGGSGAVTATELSRVTNFQLAATGPIVNLMQAYEAAGNQEEARRIGALLGRGGQGTSLESLMILAQEDLRAGRNDEAIRRLQSLASGTSLLSPLATMWTALAQDRMGDSEGSRQTLQRGMEQYRRTGQPATDGLLSVARMELERGNHAKAIEYYQLASRESPREAQIAYSLGRAFEEGGNLDQAMEQYERITSGELTFRAGASITVFDVFVQMGVIAEKRGRISDAIRYCEEALRREPKHPNSAAVRAAIVTFRSKLQGSPG